MFDDCVVALQEKGKKQPPVKLGTHALVFNEFRRLLENQELGKEPGGECQLRFFLVSTAKRRKAPDDRSVASLVKR